MIDKEKLIRDLKERQDKTRRENTYSALGEFEAYADILRSINLGKYDIKHCNVSKYYKE